MSLRLSDSHERKTAEGSIIHEKCNRDSASLELIVEEFHFLLQLLSNKFE
jgi:hypothetical protein